mmetsp:Transcript_22461/g.50697  ORF Transcript_22461/g.50697 Transcript_22461/m.50697 type:complete len:329 (-) Transcript_22461:15-1001(-)
MSCDLRAWLLIAIFAVSAQGFSVHPHAGSAAIGFQTRAPSCSLRFRDGRRTAPSRRRLATTAAAASDADKQRASEASDDSDDDDSPLPAALVPIWLGVFAQTLGEGIAISSLPLYMTTLGASPWQTGMATSCFSVFQMVCCPLLVSLSTRIGSRTVLRSCLFGAAASNLIIASSSSIQGIVLGRCLAGAFAASTPVAQVASTDVVPKTQTARALARVSASSQLGIVVGPMAVAGLAWVYESMGLAASLTTRAVFATSSAFALIVIALQGFGAAAAADDARNAEAEAQGAGGAGGTGEGSAGALGDANAALTPLRERLGQPALRLIPLG